MSRRWFREFTGPSWGEWNSNAQFRRLENAAGDAGMSLWPLMWAATLLVERGVCDREEAWDRLAFNLERLMGRRSSSASSFAKSAASSFPSRGGVGWVLMESSDES